MTKDERSLSTPRMNYQYRKSYDDQKNCIKIDAADSSRD